MPSGLPGRRAEAVARRAVFLDRDGTVIRDVGYPADPDEVELLPGAAEALRRLAGAGWSLVLASNQSGIARGLVTEDEAESVHRRTVELLAAEGVHVDGFYRCPHGPDDGCACRKPNPGMLYAAAADLGLDLEASVMVGDKASDALAGLAAGCRGIMLVDEVTDQDGEVETAVDLSDAARRILEEGR